MRLMRAVRAFPLVAVMLALLTMPVLAAGGNDGKIEGIVENGTTVTQVGNQAVTLTIYLNGSEMETKAATTSPEGTFLFEGLATATEYSYDVKVKYQEADYPSDRLDFTDGVTSKVVSITVYDSTTDPGALQIDVSHTILMAGENGLDVQVFSRIVNPTNLTYVGSKQLAPDKKETLWFTLPPGATDPQYAGDLMGCCVIPGEGGFSDTMPVMPGYREAVFSYTIPYRSAEYTLSQSFDYPTASFNLLIQDGISANGNGLTSEEPVDIEGKQFARFSLANVAAGDIVQVALTGLPLSGRQSTLRWWLPSVGALLAATVIGVFVWKKKGRPVAVPVKNDLAGQRQRLLVDIARLDDDFELGRIEEEAYRRTRTQKKAELLRIMQAAGESRS